MKKTLSFFQVTTKYMNFPPPVYLPHYFNFLSSVHFLIRPVSRSIQSFAFIFSRLFLTIFSNEADQFFIIHRPPNSAIFFLVTLPLRSNTFLYIWFDFRNYKILDLALRDWPGSAMSILKIALIFVEPFLTGLSFRFFEMPFSGFSDQDLFTFLRTPRTRHFLSLLCEIARQINIAFR